MIPPKLQALGIGGLLFVGLLLATFYAGRCSGDPFNSDQPPAVIDSTEVVDAFDFGPEIPLLEHPFRRQAQVRRAGVAPGAAQAAVDSFVAAAVDSTATPVFPVVRGWVDGDRLSLRVPRSDGAYVAREFDCPSPCRFGAGPDSTMFAQHDRVLPRLLPRIGKTALKCGAVAGAAYGIAYLAKYDQPALPAVVGGGACVVITVF